MAVEAGDVPDITVSVYRTLASCEGADVEELARFQLPPGFPLLVDRATGALVEVVFRYLHHRCVAQNALTLASAMAAADNLRLWWGYLGWRKKAWDAITAADIEAYRRGLERIVSERTGTPLAEGTIAQRITHVLELYRWANKYGPLRKVPVNLSNTRVGSVKLAANPNVSAFTYEEWRALRKQLGPLPSDGEYHPTASPCRDRLMCEVAVHTAMRRAEICGLTTHQIKAAAAKISPDADPFSAVKLLLRVVKGGPRRQRDAIVPVWLVREFLLYLDGPERTAAAARYRGKAPSPGALFLNHGWSRRNPGGRVVEKRFTAAFNEHLIAAGLVERADRGWSPDTGTSGRPRASHHVHSLRHTAAVWRYMAERAAGNPDPWKPVQTTLGHKDAETTRRIYLRITNVFEAQSSDAALAYFRRLAATSRVQDDEGDL